MTRMNYNEDDEIYNEEENDLLNSFELPPDIEDKRMVLQILDASGNIEDIIFDLEEIYRYVKKIYETSPERN